MKLRLLLLSLGALSLMTSGCAWYHPQGKYYHEHGHYHTADEVHGEHPDHHHGSARFGHPATIQR